MGIWDGLDKFLKEPFRGDLTSQEWFDYNPKEILKLNFGNEENIKVEDE